MAQLGKKIIEIRKRKWLSQEELSDEAGINLRTLQRIEKGDSEPRGHTLKSICQALDVAIEEVYDYNKENDRSILILQHLSVLAFLLMPLGNIIFPLIIWITQKRKVLHVQEQGIDVLNFQLTWSLLTYPLMVIAFFIKVMHYPGFMTLFVIYLILHVVNLLYAIVSSVIISKGAVCNLYPVAFRLIKK